MGVVVAGGNEHEAALWQATISKISSPLLLGRRRDQNGLEAKIEIEMSLRY